MNLYVVVEGITEKNVYRRWINYVNPNLTYIDELDDVTDNNYYIISGGGYPGYFDVIQGGLEEIRADNRYNRLVICIDSHDMSYADKYDEVFNFIDSFGYALDFRIVVQYYTFETWALGNKKIVTAAPQDYRLRDYLRAFNVKYEDPELLPSLEDNMTRASFSELYLRLLFRERFHQTYSKNNTKTIENRRYYINVVRRFDETNHILSFQDCLDAFI